MIWLQTATVFLVGRRKYFCKLLTVHGVNEIRQTKIHKAEPPVPDSSTFVVEIAIERLKRHKSPGISQIPAEVIQAGGRTIRSEIHEVIQ